jgi:3-oxoacyl-[acyl-carrier protein] reductase
MKLEHKVAIVTGGGTGVGRATSLKLAAGGCAVVVNYSRSADEAQATVKEIESHGGKAIDYRADVAEDSQVLEMVETTTREFGQLDILVNNAGTTEFISFSDLDAVTPETWDRIMKVNVIGAFQYRRYCECDLGRRSQRHRQQHSLRRQQGRAQQRHPLTGTNAGSGYPGKCSGPGLYNRPVAGERARRQIRGFSR